MDDLSHGAEAVAAPNRVDEHPLPVSQIEAERLAASIERAVWRETGGGVRDLHVEVEACNVLLTGHCNTYYLKQLAQHAASKVSSESDLTNRIEVS